MVFWKVISADSQVCYDNISAALDKARFHLEDGKLVTIIPVQMTVEEFIGEDSDEQTS